MTESKISHVLIRIIHPILQAKDLILRERSLFIDLGESKACKLVRPFFSKSEQKMQNKE